MRKKEFLAELESYLIDIPKGDKEEILQDYKEHFKLGKKEKRSEADIIKSLGEPKEIAREIRNELVPSKNTELKSEAVEAWVEVKKFSKHLFEEVSQGIQNISKKKKNRKEKKLSSSAIWIISLVAVLILLITSPLLVLILAIGGYIIYRKTTKESEKKGTKSSQAKKEKKNEKEWTSALRVMVSVLFNLFFFVWFWIALFFVIVGLFITSIALMIAGLAIVIFSLFALISYATELIRSLLLSSLFSGAGVFILGGMFFWLSKTLANAFFSLTKGYVRLNRRFIRK